MPKIPFRCLVVGVAVAMGLLATACSPMGTTGPLSGPYAKTIWGPDVSNYQHPYGAAIDWPAVKAQGASFAFVKMSEGDFYVNPYATSDIQGALTAGLYVGAYHFGRPRLPLSTAASDANAFAAQVGDVRLPGYLPPILDIETTDGLSAPDVTAWVQLFMATLQTDIGRPPMIYSGSWFWRGYMGDPGGFSQYPVWISDYEPQNIGPMLFGDWSYSTFWQYTDTGQIAGIPDAVDVSWFHGSPTQLAELAYVPQNASPQISREAPVTSVRAPVASPDSTVSSQRLAGSQMAQQPSTLGTGR